MKKLFGNLLVLSLVAAVISFFAAPAVAFFAIRSAADARDVAGLTRLIDFGAVRQSLRLQLADDPARMAPAPSFLQDPIAAVRRQLQQASPAAQVDAEIYLTPAALAALTRGEGRRAARGGAGAGPAGDAPMPGPVFWGMNRARLGVSGAGDARTIFTFERRGPFEWKLVHIGLPDAAAPATTRPQSGPTPAAGPAPTPDPGLPPARR